MILAKPEMDVSGTIDEVHARLDETLAGRARDVAGRQQQRQPALALKPEMLGNQPAGRGTVEEGALHCEAQRECPSGGAKRHDAVDLALAPLRLPVKAKVSDERKIPDVVQVAGQIRFAMPGALHGRDYRMSVSNGQDHSADTASRDRGAGGLAPRWGTGGVVRSRE